METVQFQLGSDPELMLRDIETKQLRSAIPTIKEGKGCGRPLDDTGENCVLHDNVLIEFNTRPAGTREEFVQTIGGVLKNITSIVADRGLELWLQTSADYPEEELKCEEARAFGCEPDFDAYRLKINVLPAEAAELPFRSTGGHLHIGKHMEDKQLRVVLDDPFGKVRVVKALDILVGLPSIFLNKDPTAARRRTLYGRAGCHRPKKYGVEWRACGPWWLGSPEHTELVHRMSGQALAVAVDEKELAKLFERLGGEERVQQIINKSQLEAARTAFQKHLHPLYDNDTQKQLEEVDGRSGVGFHAAWGL